MTAGTWALGLVCLACIWVAPYIGARRLVRRVIPGAAGAAAVLASVVLALVLITLTSEVLGSVGQFKRWPLVAASLVVAAAAALAGRSRSERQTRGRRDLATIVAAGAAVAVFARWAIGSGTSLQSGVVGVDSLQYHLPFAATFAQSGWLSQLHYAWLDPVWTFYPYGSEVFHAIGIEAFGRDVISPVLNLGWLALAMLAAWCCGRRWGAAPLALTMACVVLALPVLTESQPGSADNDIVSLALVLSAVALLFTVADTGGGYLLAAMAAGLAAGTTLSALPAVAGLVIGVLVFDKRRVPGMRRLGALGVLVPGGYWYLRNLVRIDNPLPALKVGSVHLPAPAFPAVVRYGFSVAHYVPDGWFWRDYVRPGLHQAFGSAWPVIVLLAVAGVVAPWSRRADPLLRAVGLGATVAAVVYVFTPTSAYGPPHDPFLFAANLRFLLPSVVMFMVIGAVSLPEYGLRWVEERFSARGFSTEGRRQVVWVGAAAALTGVTLLYPAGSYDQWANHPLFALLGGLAGLLVFATVLSSRQVLRVGCGLVVVVTFLVAGLPVGRSYLTDRYGNDGPIYHWARDLQRAKVGIVAFAEQYPLFGVRLDNVVSYVGTMGPHGSLVLASSCTQWRQELSRGGYNYVVIGDNDWSLAPMPELSWTQSDPAAQPVVVASRGSGPNGSVYRLGAKIANTTGC